MKILSVNIEDEIAEKIDKMAEQLSGEYDMKVSRSDVIRLAIRRYLEKVNPYADALCVIESAVRDFVEITETAGAEQASNAAKHALRIIREERILAERMDSAEKKRKVDGE